MAKAASVLRIAPFSDKSAIIKVLSQLSADSTIPRDVRGALYASLRGSADTPAPNYANKDDQQFVQDALQLLFVISDHGKDFLVELMVAYKQGNETTR